MDNISLNNGSPVKFDDIEDKARAAKDFAEGNPELEALLLTCFDQGVKTVACCAGHLGRQKPYISFEYIPENEQYLYAIMDSLSNRGYEFRYTRNKKAGSLFSVSEPEDYDFKDPTHLFRDVQAAIKNIDISKNYYQALPKDLQNYFYIIKLMENDRMMDTEETPQLVYQNSNGKYDYYLSGGDGFYVGTFINNGFKKKGSNFGLEFPYYDLSTESRDKASESLKGIIDVVKHSYANYSFELGSSIPEIMPAINIKPEVKVLDEREQLEKEVEFSFFITSQENKKIKINHLKSGENILQPHGGNKLEDVIQDLKYLQRIGLNVETIFNGIRFGNVKDANISQVIENYHRQLEKGRQRASEGQRQLNNNGISTLGFDVDNNNSNPKPKGRGRS